MYSIDQNWERAVQSHVCIMQTQQAETEKHPWTTHKFRMCFDAYAHTCERFLDYVTTHFGSKAGFADFLKEEARSLFPPKADSARLLDQYNWRASDVNAITDAEKLSLIYLYSYCALTHTAALEHERQQMAQTHSLQSA